MNLFSTLSIARLAAVALSTGLIGCSTADTTIETSNPADARRTGSSAAAAATVDPELAVAQRQFDENKFDECLATLDRVLERDRNQAPAWLLAGRANAGLAATRPAGGQFFLLDAIRALESATNLDDSDPDVWLELADLRLKNSDFEGGVEAGQRAFNRLTELEAPKARRANAALKIADNQLQAFTDARRVEIGDGDVSIKPEEPTVLLAKRALATLASAETLGGVGGAAKRSALIHQWLGRDLEAIAILERGILAEPDSSELHEAFVKAYSNGGNTSNAVGAYKRMLKTRSGNATLRWYLGRAQFGAADAERKRGDVTAAAAGYRAAAASFEDAAGLRDDFEQSCNGWRAICHLSLGRIAIDAGNLEEGAEHHTRAFEFDPAVAEYDAEGRPARWDGMQKHYLGNVARIGNKLAETGDLEKTLAYYDTLIQRHPGRFGMIYNNAALAARDLGEQIATPEPEDDPLDDGADNRRQRLEQAMELWEKSYSYYEEAVRLVPDDARIVNDCGLMLVYYLKRDDEKARAMFEKAIALGQPALDALPEDASEEEINFLSEAVGDAYQNTGVLLLQQGAPLAEQRPWFANSLRYFPYAKRESSAHLRRIDGIDQQDPDRAAKLKAFETKVKPAASKADEGDFDSALLVMDELSKEFKGFAPYHERFGLYSLRYAQSAAANGGGAGLVSGLYQDAVNQLDKAVKLDGKSADARLHLGEAAMATGKFEKALSAVDPLVKSLSGDAVLKAHATRALSAARVYATEKNGGKNNEDALEAARGSFAALEKARGLNAAERGAWITTERWAGASKSAVDVVARALKANPEDQTLLGELVSTTSQVGETKLGVDILKSRKDAVGTWYYGRALYDHGVNRWNGGKPDEAIKSLDAGVEAFAKASALNSDYTQSCKEWTGFCLGAKGLVEVSQDSLDKAQTSLVSALESHPGALEANLNGNTIKRGLMVIADKHFKARDLGKTADTYIAAGKVAPNDVDLSNNEGLFCRDYGVNLSRSGKAKKAEPYFEASYAAYTRAHAADPGNVRLRNDRALILIYHLDREYETIESLLASAIADGEARLKDDPPSDADELQNLQEAVGDSYENLGFYHMTKSNKLAEARAALEKSMTYYPGPRRASRRHLQRLEGMEKGK